MKLQLNDSYILEKTNFEAFKEKIDKINSKSPNLIQINVIESFENNSDSGIIKFVKFSLDNYIQSVNNFLVIARKQMSGSSPVIDSFNNSIPIPESFFSSSLTCQHCKSKRNRKKVFLLFNSSSNQFIQIGSSCLKDFTGKSVADFIFFEKSVDSLISFLDSPPCHYTPYFKVSHVLAQAFRLAQKGHKYISNQLASQLNKLNPDPDSHVSSTPELVFQSLLNKNKLIPFSQDELDQTLSIINWFSSQNSNNPDQLFVSNALSILNEDSIPFSFISRITFVSFSYFNSHWIPSSSSFFPGKVGDRISQYVKLIHSRKFSSFSSDNNFVYNFSNSSNNIFVWFSNSPIPILSNSSDHQFLLTGNIQKFTEFKSVKQTVLKDCSISLA